MFADGIDAVAIVNNRNRSRLSFPGPTTALALRLDRSSDLVYFFGRKLSDGVRVVLMEYNLGRSLNEFLHGRLLSVHTHLHVRWSASTRAAGLVTIVGRLVAALVRQ